MAKFYQSDQRFTLGQMLPPSFHPDITLGSTIVIGIEPLIPGGLESTVVTVIKSMMLLMKKIAQSESYIFSDQQIFVTTMRRDSGNGLELQNKYGEYRMRWDEHQYKDSAKPDRVFNRMHGCP